MGFGFEGVGFKAARACGSVCMGCSTLDRPMPTQAGAEMALWAELACLACGPGIAQDGDAWSMYVCALEPGFYLQG